MPVFSPRIEPHNSHPPQSPARASLQLPHGGLGATQGDGKAALGQLFKIRRQQARRGELGRQMVVGLILIGEELRLRAHHDLHGAIGNGECGNVKQVRHCPGSRKGQNAFVSALAA